MSSLGPTGQTLIIALPLRDVTNTLGRFGNIELLVTVAILGIAYQDGTSDAESFARRQGIPYPLLADPAAQAADEYGVSGVPETIVVSASAMVSATFDSLTASYTRRHNLRTAL